MRSEASSTEHALRVRHVARRFTLAGCDTVLLGYYGRKALTVDAMISSMGRASYEVMAVRVSVWIVRRSIAKRSW